MSAVLDEAERCYRRMAALWGSLKAPDREATYREAMERVAGKLEAGDVREGTALLFDQATGQFPPLPAEWVGCVLTARQRRLDAVPKRRPANQPGPQIRRVVGRTCSRAGCHGALDLLVAEGVLWCARCRSVQRAARGTERTRLTEDERDGLTFADPADLPARDGEPVGVETARALVARLAERKAMPQVKRGDPDDPELARLVRVQAEAHRRRVSPPIIGDAGE